MPVVRAGPNQYLLVGRRGKLENRGSAVQAILRPGTIWVLVPATKQEATFEFTQETRDGIPLRFKGSSSIASPTREPQRSSSTSARATG